MVSSLDHTISLFTFSLTVILDTVLNHSYCSITDALLVSWRTVIKLNTILQPELHANWTKQEEYSTFSIQYSWFPPQYDVQLFCNGTSCHYWLMLSLFYRTNPRAYSKQMLFDQLFLIFLFCICTFDHFFFLKAEFYNFFLTLLAISLDQFSNRSSFELDYSSQVCLQFHPHQTQFTWSASLVSIFSVPFSRSLMTRYPSKSIFNFADFQSIFH